MAQIEVLNPLNPLNSEHDDDLVNEVKFKLFESIIDNTKKTTQKLYQSSGIKLSGIESKVKQLNQYSTPYVNKLTGMLDKQLDSTLHKCQDFKGILQQQKEQIIEKSKNSSLVKKADNLSLNLLTHLESQVDHLSKLLKQSEIVVQEKDSEQLSLHQRTVRLANSVNWLTKQLYSDYIQKIKSSAQFQYFSQQLKNFEMQKVQIFQNAKTFVEVVNEMGAEVLKCQIYQPINNNYVQPTLQKSLDLYTSSKEKLILEYSRINKELVQQVLPLMKQKYTNLQTATVTFYKQYISIEFAQEFYAKNKTVIVEQTNNFYKETKEILAKQKQQSEKMYQKVLKQYQERKQKLLEQNSQQYKQQLDNSSQQQQNLQSQQPSNLSKDI